MSRHYANYIQALVYADNAEGANARLLMFPRPGKRSDVNPAESLFNIRWFPRQRELTELFVDPESTICCSEGRCGWMQKRSRNSSSGGRHGIAAAKKAGG